MKEATYHDSTSPATALLITLVIWELGWKSVALWKAKGRNEWGWFIAILLISSIGILPIVYLATHRDDSYDEKSETPEDVALL